MTTLLRANRLTLRPVREADAEAVVTLLGNDSAAIQMTGRIPDPLTLEDAAAWLTGKVTPHEHAFAIERTTDGRFLGCVGVIEMEGTAGLGYWIGRPFWGQGYATEAGAAALCFARSLGKVRAVADAFPRNVASRRVLDKLGFVFDGEVERFLPMRGGRRTLMQYRRDL